MSSDLFLIGSSGTKAYRAAMGAVSENITNANTANYARRTVSTKQSSISASTGGLYVSQATFGGTEIAGVNRASDPYLDANVRLTSNALEDANARLRWLTDIETGLDDSDTGIGHLMSGMYSNIEKLSANPQDNALRTTLLYSMSQVVDAFHQTAADLQSAQDGIATSAQDSVNSINNALTELARVNASLLRSQAGTTNQAQLLDARDAALATLSANLNVTISFGANESASVGYDGVTLVQGSNADALSVVQASDGTLSIQHSGTTLTTPSGGSLGGLFSAASVAADRVTSLNTLADQFVTDMNGWHTGGLTDGGAAGGDLFSIGSSASSLQLLLSDTSQIAAASSDGRLNGNLLNISSVRGTGGVEQGWTAIIAAHGNLLNGVKTEQEAAQSRSDQAVAAREQVSGVDLDTEAADLLRIQQAYSGCAKIIQVARETVQAILDII